MDLMAHFEPFKCAVLVTHEAVDLRELIRVRNAIRLFISLRRGLQRFGIFTTAVQDYGVHITHPLHGLARDMFRSRFEPATQKVNSCNAAVNSRSVGLHAQASAVDLERVVLAAKSGVHVSEAAVRNDRERVELQDLLRQCDRLIVTGQRTAILAEARRV